ncbi:hypothetical protein BW14_05635 [Bifidobacterium sp. UTBIF-68]|nr:hypothetical protein BW14_05635 [Bifidobacterium sp. UTBIF-68]
MSIMGKDVPVSRRTVWRSALAQLRFDVARGSSDLGYELVMGAVLLFAVVVGVLVRFVGMDARVAGGLMGGITGLAVVAGWMMALVPSMMEDQDGHRAMAGLVPIARTPQVIGRFLYLLASAVAWSVEVGVCRLVFDVLADGAVDGVGVSASVATVFAMSMIVGSIMLACTYRFGIRQLMIVFAAMMGALYLLAALVSFLPIPWEPIILTVFEFLSVPWRSVLVGAVFCFAVYGVSMGIAIRLFNAKEL